MENKNTKWVRTTRAGAFTLIELLVVIAIIGIIAALLVNLAGPAAKGRKIARVNAELNQLVTVIESYKAAKNFYPPSHTNSINVVSNQLFYELTGTIYSEANNEFQTINGSEKISPATVDSFFGAKGFVNSATDRSEVKNYFPNLKAAQYAEISSNPDVELLIVPVEGPNDTPTPSGKKINPWRYNSVNPVHNPDTFDLWAEIVIGGKTNIIGNWKE